MPNKHLFPLLLVLGAALTLRGELIRKSQLLQSSLPFAISKDIFTAQPAILSGVGAPRAQTEPEKEKRKTVQEEINQSIVYEGYLVKNAKRTALLSVSGDFFFVNEGDTILDKIRIVRISQATVMIEYENQKFEIQIKGEENG